MFWWMIQSIIFVAHQNLHSVSVLYYCLMVIFSKCFAKTDLNLINPISRPIKRLCCWLWSSSVLCYYNNARAACVIYDLYHSLTGPLSSPLGDEHGCIWRRQNVGKIISNVYYCKRIIIMLNYIPCAQGHFIIQELSYLICQITEILMCAGMADWICMHLHRPVCRQQIVHVCVCVWNADGQ